MQSKFPLARRLGLLMAAIVAVYLTLSLVGGIRLMEGALHPAKRPLKHRSEFVQSVAHWADRGLTDASVTANDGAVLRGWYVRPKIWNGSTVFLLHGVADNRLGVTPYAGVFLRAGYAVLLPDARAQGESGGTIETYGLLESGDLRHWAEWLRGQGPMAKQCTYLFGESLGAAIALQAADSVPGLCAVAAEAPFSSFREIGYERIAQSLGVRPAVSHVVAWPLVNLSFLYARLRYGVDLNQASPEASVASSKVPVLLIAGTEDRNIPLQHSERILAQAGNGGELWRVPGAGHTNAISIAPAEFEHRVLAWFALHASPASSPSR